MRTPYQNSQHHHAEIEKIKNQLLSRGSGRISVASTHSRYASGGGAAAVISTEDTHAGLEEGERPSQQALPSSRGRLSGDGQRNGAQQDDIALQVQQLAGLVDDLAGKLSTLSKGVNSDYKNVRNQNEVYERELARVRRQNKTIVENASLFTAATQNAPSKVGPPATRGTALADSTQSRSTLHLRRLAAGSQKSIKLRESVPTAESNPSSYPTSQPASQNASTIIPPELLHQPYWVQTAAGSND